MSGHERERLAGFLDGELPAAERAEVEAHLAGCAECASLLASLAAVDEAAAAWAAEAPSGYFEDFSARVRSRVERPPAAASRRTLRLPTWAWAAAAVLLLAVVTPLTLREGEQTRSTAETGAAVRAAKPASEPPAPVLPATAAPPATQKQGAGSRQAELQQTAPGVAARHFAREAAPSGGGEASGRLEDERLKADREAAPKPPPAPAIEEQAAPAARPVSPQTANALPPSSPRQPEAKTAFAGAPPVEESPQEVDRVAGSTASAAAVARGAATTAAPARKDETAVLQQLRAMHPQTAGEWRQLREGWRDFLRAYPEGARADEARVSMIEAGLQAARLSGADEDLQVFEQDSARYLARRDAMQKARVRRLLEQQGPD